MLTWDPDKNEENKRKHRIAFEDAVTVFGGPTLEKYDAREDYGEDRWAGRDRVNARRTRVVLVYTDRGELIRVISARKATTHERKEYEAYLRSL